jgi:hypothetical protein
MFSAINSLIFGYLFEQLASEYLFFFIVMLNSEAATPFKQNLTILVKQIIKIK